MRRSRIWRIGVGLLVALSCLSLQWGRAPQAEERRLRLRGHDLSSAYGSGQGFGRMWHGPNPLTSMHFH
jgi:hypothetical protein